MNVFAGINRCDWVAQGVVQAVREVRVPVPLVVRLAGTNVEEGRRILKESGLQIDTADTLSEAAERVVAARKASPPNPLSVPERGGVLSSPSPEGRGGQGVRIP